MTRLDYLLTGLGFQRADGSWLEPGDWAEYISHQRVRFMAQVDDLPPEAFKAIRFRVGVDPARNAADPNTLPPRHPLHPEECRLHWGMLGGVYFPRVRGTLAAAWPHACERGWVFVSHRDRPECDDDRIAGRVPRRSADHGSSRLRSREGARNIDFCATVIQAIRVRATRWLRGSRRTSRARFAWWRSSPTSFIRFRVRVRSSPSSGPEPLRIGSTSASVCRARRSRWTIRPRWKGSSWAGASLPTRASRKTTPNRAPRAINKPMRSRIRAGPARERRDSRDAATRCRFSTWPGVSRSSGTGAPRRFGNKLLVPIQDAHEMNETLDRVVGKLGATPTIPGYSRAPSAATGSVPSDSRSRSSNSSSRSSRRIRGSIAPRADSPP